MTEAEVVAREERGGEGEVEPSFFADPRRIAMTLGAVVLLIAGIYVVLPKLVGAQDALNKLGDANVLWLAVALAFEVASFVAYILLFKAVVAERVDHVGWREAYQIALAGLVATLLFSAAGAGGIVLFYWALRKAGMERRQSACRLVAFYVLQYGVYLLALVVFGALLRSGALSGEAPLGLTIVPAAIAGAVVVAFLAIALLPQDFERRIARLAAGYRFARLAHRLSTVPATLASGTRTALQFAREPSRGGEALAGAIGYWACNVGILWASFHAYSVSVPLGVVIQGFFVGTAANLTPFAPAGVGAVDAGLIGSFVLFGLPSSGVFAAVLTYRLIAYWLPIPFGVVAFFQLRGTASRWEAEGVAAPRRRAGIGGPVTSQSKV